MQSRGELIFIPAFFVFVQSSILMKVCRTPQLGSGASSTPLTASTSESNRLKNREHHEYRRKPPNEIPMLRYQITSFAKERLVKHLCLGTFSALRCLG